MKCFLTTVFLFIVLVPLVDAGDPCHSTQSSQASDRIDSLLKKVELIPIMVTGDKNNRINIVLMNRWTPREKEPYNSPAMKAEFLKDIRESIIAALTPGDQRAQTAYANYREFFNVYGLWYPETPEWNHGIDEKTVDALRDRLFLPWKDEYRGWVTFLVMPNSDNGGGGASRNLEKRVGTALIAGNGIGKMLHEIAHTCMSIGDEYTANATGTSAVATYSVTKEYEREKIKWIKWIEPDTPLPTPYTDEYRNKIGAFEGAQYHLTRYFRSTAQGCIMGAGVFDNTEKMCPVCEQRLAMRVNSLVNPVNSYKPSETSIQIAGKTSIHFEIDHIRPVPDTQVVKWILNGRTIVSGADEIDVDFGGIANYELTCSLTDETPFIRPDPPYAFYPKLEITWKITNSAPTSKAENMVINISSIPDQDRSGKFSLRADVNGGTPPYHYQWSEGYTDPVLKNAVPGIYDLIVTDSEFRDAKTHFSVYESVVNKSGLPEDSKKVKKPAGSDNLKVEATSSDYGRKNGKISVTAQGGSGPFDYVWLDGKYQYGEGRIYEAENSVIQIPGHQVKDYFGARNNAFVDFNHNEGALRWTVEVAQSGPFPVDIIYAAVLQSEISMEMLVNGKPVENQMKFYPTRPLFTGWETATVNVFLKEGENVVTLKSTGNSGPNIDYIRLPANYSVSYVKGRERINLSPGSYTVVIKGNDKKSSQKTIKLQEVYPFEITGLKVEVTKPGILGIVNPLTDYDYLWYAGDAPFYSLEKYENPLHAGNEFAPSGPGNYYIAARNKLTNAESRNRIGITVSNSPEKIINQLNPSSLNEESITLWFDSSDLDGDGNLDGKIPERGPLSDWKEKTWRNPGKIMAKYEPNRLNGMGVCSFDNVWISNIGKKISGIQSVFLVYRESSMTFAGKSPFKELNPYLGKSKDPSKRLFDPESTDDRTKLGNVYLNSKKVDPFNTPNPMEFCLLTVEFESPVTDSVSVVEGYFEGEIAEMLFIDKILAEPERKGIEEYLRKKWIASVDLEFEADTHGKNSLLK